MLKNYVEYQVASSNKNSIDNTPVKDKQNFFLKQFDLQE